jgi:hypothetical protein
MLDVVRQKFNIISHAVQAQLNAEMALDLTGTFPKCRCDPAFPDHPLSLAFDLNGSNICAPSQNDKFWLWGCSFDIGNASLVLS